MGALHAGHASLIRSARQIVGLHGSVAVSLFVNPLQFGPNEDLARYPRSLEADAALCEKEGATLLFHPSPREMYAPDASVKIEETELSRHLCGASRPGHFSGVATVVTKLFNIIAPDKALFGEKDWQQLAIVRRFVRDLNFSIEVLSHPIVREHDGLAMSSRNQYLTAKERTVAPAIYQALCAAAKATASGETIVSKLLDTTRATISAIPKATIDYTQIVDERTLEPLSEISSKASGRLMVAVKLGNVRLIDNIALTLGEQNS